MRTVHLSMLLAALQLAVLPMCAAQSLPTVQLDLNGHSDTGLITRAAVGNTIKIEGTVKTRACMTGMTVWAEDATPGKVIPVAIAHVTETGNGSSPSITVTNGIARVVWSNDNARCATYVFLVNVSGTSNYTIHASSSKEAAQNKHYDDVGNIDMMPGTTSPGLGFSALTDNSGFYGSVRNAATEASPSHVIRSGSVSMLTAGSFTITSVTIEPVAMIASIAKDGKSFTFSGGEVRTHAILSFWITLSASPTHDGTISINVSSQNP